MGSPSMCHFGLLVVLLIIISTTSVKSGDVQTDDASIPASPSCHNETQLVKVKTFLDGKEDEIFGGLSARFGVLLPSDDEKAQKLAAVVPNPAIVCSNSSVKLSGMVALSARGVCDFTTKAEIAQSGGAAALLVINNEEDIFEMVCPQDNSKLNISIPVVMVTNSTGDSLKSMAGSGKLEILLYSPERPVVDGGVAFLWLMAVGTVICASFWEEMTTTEQTEEHYNGLSPKVYIYAPLPCNVECPPRCADINCIRRASLVESWVKFYRVIQGFKTIMIIMIKSMGIVRPIIFIYERDMSNLPQPK